MNDRAEHNLPRISVIVPTYRRPERVASLLECLDRQTLDPREFEVLLVDDGSPTPLEVDPAKHRFALFVLRQANAGPASARNLGAKHARAPLVMFLNDDALPHANLLALHLETHATRRGKFAVLGAFPFTKHALAEPFTRLLADSNLLFDFPGLKHGELHDWTYFWTCNISLPKAAFDEVGGFDAETFREAIVEDVELGLRLQNNGYRVLHRADAICEHEHALDVDHYFARAVRLGVNLARMWKKHGDPRILWQPAGSRIGADYFLALQLKCEAFHATSIKFVETTRRWSERMRDAVIQPNELAELQKLTRQLSTVPLLRGILLELTGVDPGRVIDQGPTRGRLTSIIACSYNALSKTQACIESLRRTADPDFPTEIIVVDNGSTDGSAEWLAEQVDVRLIANQENVGAPRARNQAVPFATGSYVVFLDNDIVLTPNWLERMLFHAEIDANTACVGACADRASHGQQLEYRGATDFDSLARFARSNAGMNHRRSKLVGTLASFCILVKRSTLDEIGGFDERFSPWGFEDDDYTLRALFAGRFNRIALDVFVRHDSYDGPKLERHTALLERNWKLFAQKWGLGDAPYGDFSAIEAARRRNWTREELYVPVGTIAPALPKRAGLSHASLLSNERTSGS